MPLFERSNQNLKLIRPARFTNEKELQQLVEANLTTIFNCRFVASEFSTGPMHGGRIDTLAISEDDNPVVIEYKIVGLDDAVEEAPKKLHIAYKVSQNFACVEVHKSRILLYLKIDPATVDPMPENCRNVSKIGHFGTGDFEVAVSNESELEIAKRFVEMSFANIGGN